MLNSLELMQLRGWAVTLHLSNLITQVYGLMERGQERRTTGPTKLNEMSSRSHAVFIVIVEKSSVLSDYAEANNSEMQQFRGLAPGMAPSAISFPPC
jgi:hypothetical protein